MSKSIYVPDSGGIARQAKKIYIPVDGVAHKVKKIYVGDADNKARLAFSSEYVWKKYVSKKISSVVRYEDSMSAFVDITAIQLWPTPSSDFFTPLSDGSGYSTYVGTGWAYTETSGTFWLTGTTRIYTSNTVSFSKYDVQSKFCGKWIMNNSSTKIYKLEDTAVSGEFISAQDMRKAGASYMLYTYTYEYKGDVTSENENAYTSGSVGDYTSRSSTDVRTVYIRKD